MEKDEDQSLLSYCQTALKTLIGDERVPKDCPMTQPEAGDAIVDRSVIFYENQRTLAVDYLEYLARGLGYTDIVRQKWTQTAHPRFKDVKSCEVPYENLIVTIKGSESPQETIIVGAHYDVQNSYSGAWRGREHGPDEYTATDGADDNGSGVIGCMALLKKFAYQSFQRTIKVVFFDGEEPGIINQLCSGSKFFKNSIDPNSTKDQLESEEDGWTCGTCSFINSDNTDTTCSGCGEIKLGDKITKDNIKLVFIIDMIGGEPTFEPHGFYISTSSDDVVDYWQDKVKNWRQTKNTETNVTFGRVKDDENCIHYSDSRYFAEDGLPCLLLGSGSFSHLPYFYHNTRDNISIISWTTFIFAVELAEFIITYQAQNQQK